MAEKEGIQVPSRPPPLSPSPSALHAAPMAFAATMSTLGVTPVVGRCTRTRAVRVRAAALVGPAAAATNPTTVFTSRGPSLAVHRGAHRIASHRIAAVGVGGAAEGDVSDAASRAVDAQAWIDAHARAASGEGEVDYKAILTYFGATVGRCSTTADEPQIGTAWN